MRSTKRSAHSNHSLGSEARPRPHLASPGRLLSTRRLLPVLSPLSVLACVCPISRRSKRVSSTPKQPHSTDKLLIAPLVSPCTPPLPSTPLSRCISLTPSRISISVNRKRRPRHSPPTSNAIRLSPFEELHLRAVTPILMRAR